MSSFLIPIIFGVGMLLPTQAAMNANLSRHLGDPLWAGSWNNAVGLAVMLVLALAIGQRPDFARAVSAAPWWAYWGGCLGAVLVVSTLVAAPRLGASLMVACLIAGQMISSLLFDHFAWLGFAHRPITPGRIAGVALLAGGVWLIRRF